MIEFHLMEANHKSSLTYFRDFLKPTQIIYDLKSREKVEAIEELLDILVKQKLISNKKLILTRVIDRENLVSTAIGSGVALPHARVDTDGQIAVAVGRSEKGIDFDAHDGQKVYLIILIIWNPSLPGLFNHLFAGLARFLNKAENKRRLMAAGNKTEFYNILSQIEFKFIRDEKILSQAALLRKLQEIEIKRRRVSREQQKDLQKQANMIREDLDRDLLSRFDRLMERYAFAVAEVIEGVCQGCNINISTQMNSAIEGSNDIYVCENCGKFLVSVSRKKKK